MEASGGLSGATDFFFQAVFAATAVTIASGALAERTKFSTYLIFSVVTTVIYPIVVHWTWGGGLIAQISIGDAVYSDFAGSTIVHSVGGWLALIGALMVGPRIGKYGARWKRAHNSRTQHHPRNIGSLHPSGSVGLDLTLDPS